MRNLNRTFLLLPFLAYTSVLQAQVTVTQVSDQDAINNVLIGNGVNVSNIQSFGTSPLQIGEFTNGLSSNIGIDHGVLLTSGFINPSAGPISSPGGTFVSDGAGSPGDADLTAICGNVTYDAAILQFDFIPTGDTIKFNYVFASEEYPEFVGSGFNDVFAFMLTGPDPQGGNYVNTNVALIPGTSIPVSINNVNQNLNTAYYNDNQFGINFVFDGYTTVLTAIAAVVPCTTYTIKLALSDAGDSGYDSGVFLQANSFSSNQVTLSSEINYGTSDTLMYEGCSQASVQFIRGGDVSGADTADFVVSGSATMGSDYNNLPQFIIFPPGVDTVTLVITPFLDGNNDPNETVIISVYDTICGNPVVSQLTLVIYNIEPLQVVAMPDTILCDGESVSLQFNATGGGGFYASQWLWQNGPSAPPLTVTPGNNGMYVISVYDDCIDTTAYDTIFVEVYPTPNLALPDVVSCSGVPVNLGPTGNYNGFNFNWVPATGLNQTTVQNPTFIGQNQTGSNQLLTYYLLVDSNGVTCAGDSALILLYPEAELDLQPDTAIFCEDSFIQVTAPAGYLMYTWSTGATGISETITQPGLYTLTILDSNTCMKSDSVLVIQSNKPQFSIEDALICSGDTAVLTVPDSLGAILWSTLETTPAILVTGQGEFIVSISNACGAASDTVLVTLQPNLQNLELPNIFTPNGDGINDTYEIPSLALSESFKIDIYNRWGLRLYSSTNLAEPWTGKTDAGADAAEGTYFVIVEYTNCSGESETLNNTINLVRAQ